MIEGILLGISTVFTPTNLMMVMAGCLVGTFIGLLPGLGPISAIALMIPIAYGFDPASSMILMAGVYYGAIFGGSTSSILINAPGVAGTVATSFDGYPLAKKGFPGKALAIAAYSSFAGGTIASIFLLLSAPALAKVAVSFHSADYFCLMIMGLTAVSAFAGRGQFLRAILATILGLMLSTIGMDQNSGVQRFAFGNINLIDGISFLLLAMATFALAEAIMNVLKRTGNHVSRESGNLGGLKLNWQEVKTIIPPIGRSSVFGFLIGVLPGAGATIASFLAYGMERNLASPKDKKEFGKGSLRGLAAPETANNAACTGSFVPLLTLGIPGSGTTAIMLGALISFGIQPGPLLITQNPALFWSVIISMYIGNVFLFVLNLPLIPYIAKLLEVPTKYLTPLVIFFSLIGVYLVSFNSFDLQMMVIIAICAVLLRLLDFPMAPMLMGFILGGLMETNLRRALLINDESVSFLWDRPISLTINIVTICVILIPLISYIRAKVLSRNSSDKQVA